MNSSRGARSLSPDTPTNGLHLRMVRRHRADGQTSTLARDANVSAMVELLTGLFAPKWRTVL